jgi:octaprenyl-diphosphate synthase
MSQVRPAAGDRAALSRLFAAIAPELGAVERRLQAELRHPDPAIDELAKHSFRMGGKRLRPALLLLAGQAVGRIGEAHHTLGAVVEMIHTATLVHDDVLDEADLRRHMDTVNARWNNRTSILLGDYLFSHAFYLASTLDSTYACQAIGKATNVVCEGELKQTASAGDFLLSRQQYLDIIDAKTAALCACCCRLGARYSGGDAAAIEGLARYGRDLGMAFQIVDDLLDLEGEECTAGKSLGTDLMHSKMTLPLILLRDQFSPAERTKLQALCEEPGEGHTQLLLEWLDESGALREARSEAEEFARQAVQALAPLDDSAARKTLVDLAGFVVSRSA